MTISRRILLAAAGLTAAGAFGVPTLGLAATGSPSNPRRVAVLEYATLDVMRLWGLEERIVAASDPASAVFLAPLPKSIVSTGGLKSAPLDVLEAARPDLIVISGRLERRKAEIERIAPVLSISPDLAGGALASYRRNLETLGSIFGREKEADQLARAAEARVAAIRSRAAGARAAVLMLNEGRIGMLAPGGRCSLISAEFGFTNVVEPRKGAAPKKGGPKLDAAAIARGNAETLEKLKALAPEYIFILNKDIAVGRSPATDLEAIWGEGWKALPAVRAGRAVMLSHAAWYLGEGGPSAMNLMLGDVERALRS